MEWALFIAGVVWASFILADIAAGRDVAQKNVIRRLQYELQKVQALERHEMPPVPPNTLVRR